MAKGHQIVWPLKLIRRPYHGKLMSSFVWCKELPNRALTECIHYLPIHVDPCTQRIDNI